MLKLTNQSESSSDKPLVRTNSFLCELKEVAIHVRELLVEVKEIVVILGMIAIFAAGILAMLSKLPH